MSKQEKRELIMSESPELLLLLDDFKPVLKDLRENVQPLVKKVRVIYYFDTLASFLMS